MISHLCGRFISEFLVSIFFYYYSGLVMILQNRGNKHFLRHFKLTKLNHDWTDVRFQTFPPLPRACTHDKNKHGDTLLIRWYTSV